MALCRAVGVHLSRGGHRIVIVDWKPIRIWVLGPLSYFGLTVHHALRLAIGVGVPDVEVPQGLALAVYVDTPLMAYNGLIIWGRSVRGNNDGTVSMAGNVVWSHDVTAWNTEVGGHWRSLDEVLGMVERVHTGCAIHTAIRDCVEVDWTPFQASLGPVVGPFIEENAVLRGASFLVMLSILAVYRWQDKWSWQ